MRFPRRYLHALSQDFRTLRQLILILAAAFFVNALWLGIQRPAKPWSVDFPTELAGSVPKTPNPSNLPEWVEYLRAQAAKPALDSTGATPTDPAAHQKIGESSLEEAEKRRLVSWYDGLISGKISPELFADIRSWDLPAHRWLPAQMTGDLHLRLREWSQALAEYERAASIPGGEAARRQAIQVALNRGWREHIDRLMDQPGYYQTIHGRSDTLSDLVAREQLDVVQLFRSTFASFLEALRKWDYLLLSLLCSGVWYVSLHKACRLPLRQWWLGLPAIVLGVFSTVVTLVLLALQEARQGLTDSDLAGTALLFQIASVGLREEIAKLLCFLPLLWFLRKGTPAQALMAGSCVGLGFALEENVGYYAMYGGEAVLSRFVTATFMHIALTGLAAHALFKFLRYPRNYGGQFAGTFTGVVLLHGFYNYSLSGFDDWASVELGSLTGFMLAGLGWFYFQTLRQEQDKGPVQFSAQAVFLLGTTIVCGVLLNTLVWVHGWEGALDSFVPSALGALLYGYLFHRFLSET